jgi:predicted enzyme related to lactoylglutathione lyase
MPTRDHTPAGAPCWVDLQTSSTEQARAFYTSVFGWSAEEPNPEFGGYFNFTKDGVLVAGCMASDSQAPVSDVWSVYLASPDVAKTLQSATEHGGQVYVQPMPVGDLGTMAFLLDAGSAGIGVWQPGQFRGFGVLAEPGAPSYFEVMAKDYQATVAFYRDVFGLDTEVVSDTPEFRYTTLRAAGGKDPVAGVMDAAAFLPEDVPAHWSVYFGVEDTDAALARIVELGGAVVIPAEDTPYGRLATAKDPTGAVFKLVAANEAMPART